MEANKILEEINVLFRDILDNDSIVVTPQTKAEDIDEWDSLTHIQLIVAIEKQFKLKFSSKEISNWENVGEMIKCIIQKQGGDTATKVTRKETSEEPKVFVKASLDEMKNEDIPSYRRNFIHEHKFLTHGKNCFVSEGATITNVRMGDQVWINKFATVFSSHDFVTIGSNCYIGPYVWIEGHAGIEIGDSVHIAGPGTNLYTHSGMKMAINGQHLGNPGYKPVLEKDHYFKVPIRIGNNVWIGPNCSISPGVIIKDFVVVMPNTHVKSGIIESYSVVSGNGQIETNSDFVKSMLNEKIKSH
jgi:acyl carrier protein